MPITAPDTRKLQLIIREGEQHDLYQFVGDFFELYGMSANSVGGMVAEVNKRLAGRIMFIIIFALRRMEPSGIPSPPPPSRCILWIRISLHRMCDNLSFNLFNETMSPTTAHILLKSSLS